MRQRQLERGTAPVGLARLSLGTKNFKFPGRAQREVAGDSLDAKRFFPNDLGAIVVRWCFSDIHKIARRNSRDNRSISPNQLLHMLGPDRLRILTRYSGLQTGHLLDRLSDELSAEIRLFRLFR